MRAASSRAKWEAERAAEAKVKGLHPLPTLNVFFSERFERRRWPLRDAVAMLREAAVPEMFNCLENPLYAKVSVGMVFCFQRNAFITSSFGVIVW